ncbi:MAG: PAS domain S-box protein [Bacteroidales bacterium]|nr:PAS domain S-box protein [Bacteroidales bacterium]
MIIVVSIILFLIMFYLLAYKIVNDKILNNLTDKVGVLNEKGKFIFKNNNFKNLFKKQKTLACYEAVHGSNEPHKDCPYQRSKVSKKREEMIEKIDNKYYKIIVDPIEVIRDKMYVYFHIMTEVSDLIEKDLKIEEERKNLENILNNVPGFIYRCANDKNWTMYYLSKGFKQLTGYDIDEVLNNNKISYNEIICEEYRESIWEKYQEVIRSKTTFEGEYQIMRKNGERIWVWERGTPVFDKEGNISYIEGYVTSVNEKIEALKKAEEQEMLLSSLLNNIPIAVFLYQDPNFIYVNPATEKISEYSREELLHMNFWQLVHPDFKELVKERGLKRLKGEDQPSEYNFKIVTKYGKEKWIRFNAHLLKNYKGKPAAIGSAIDITSFIEANEKLKTLYEEIKNKEFQLNIQNEELLSLNDELKEKINNIKRLNQELLSVKEKLEKSNEVKNVLINNISHEIKTPLNSIIGFSDLILKKEGVEDKIKEYVKIIKFSSSNLLNIINTMIQTSELGKETIFYKNTDVNKIVKFIVDNFKPIAISKNIEFDCIKYLPKNTSKILTDETKLIQIISNLVKNAISFTKEGYVHISCEIENNNLIVSVEDTGCGIEEDLIPYIFEPFVRLYDITKSYESGGTGLGLSICKSYVQQLGGEIYVKSEVGKGSKFWFIIPVIIS